MFASARKTSHALGASSAFGACVGVTILAANLSTSASCDEDKPMYYRMLGNTGLQVSVLSYGKIMSVQGTFHFLTSVFSRILGNFWCEG